jgi:PAS domain S-box-containing protein
MLAVCTYSLDKCGASEIIDVVSNHQFAVVRQGGKWGLIESSERKQAEKTLRESEERLKILFECAPDAYFLYDLKGSLVDGNRMMEELAGCKKAEIIGKNFVELKLLPLEEIPKVAASLAKSTLGQATGPLELIINREDGNQAIVEIRTFPVKIRGQALVLGIARDITKRKQMEAALRESRERYKELADFLPQTVFEIDETGNFIFANRHGFEISGYTQQDIDKGLNALQLFIPEDRNRVRENIRRILAGEQLSGTEYTVMRKDGSTFPALAYSVPITRGGKPVGLRGLVIDITERKWMEEVLKDSEEKYRSLVNNVKLGIFRSTPGPTGRFMEVNPAMEDITGYPREELLKMDVSRLYVHPEEREAILQEIASTTGKVTKELLFRKKDGTEIVVSDTKVAVRDNAGKTLYFDGIIDDITERKWMEEDLQEKNRQLVKQQQELIEKTNELEVVSQAKSDFLAHMSHELRTPLNVIIGFSELMLDGVPGEINNEQKQCLDDVLSSGKNLLELINDVLDLAKVESGKVNLRLSDIALTDVIEELKRTMTPILTPRRQSLDIEIEEGLPPVHADKGKLRQVLLNLLSNATKFTPDGGRLKIEAVKKDHSCQVSVADNGTGIKKEDQERLFEPFSQLDNPLTGGKGGTGLGLALSKQIIEKHGGQIWIESEYGKGSRFTFTLPLATTI